MSGSPREQLGIELKRLRLATGMSQPKLAKALGVNQSKVSRTELGSFPTGPELVQAWLRATNASPDEVARITSLSLDALTDVTPYRRIFRGSLAATQRSRIEQDARAQQIRHFQPFMIPGPLQDAAYARAAILAARVGDETDLDEAVALRLERGRRMRQGGPAYKVIMTEWALRFRPLGVTPEALASTLRHLAKTGASAKNIEVRVISLGAQMGRAAMCGFMLTEFADPENMPIVQVELPAAEVTFTAPDDIAAFDAVWGLYEEAAEHPRKSLELIRALAESSR